MFVKVKKKDEKRWQLTIVESVRKGKKVSQKTVRNIGTAYSEKEVEEFRKIGEAAIISMKNSVKPVLSFDDPANFHAPGKRKKCTEKHIVDVHDLREEKRINEGFTDIFGQIYKEIGLESIITESKFNDQWNDIIQSTVIARVANPKSKLATLNQLENQFDIKIPFQKIYRAMDQLAKHEDKAKELIRNHTLGLFRDKVDILFFDVTTLYFESINSDDFKNFGFSKDNKFKEVQVMLALIATEDGLPVTYKLFPGNSFEGHTLKETIDELRSDFDVSNFVFVADRGMFNENNLKYMDDNGISYVVGASLKKMSNQIKNEILTDQFSPMVIGNDFQWVREYEYKKRRLIVSYSSKRAKKDASDRQRLIDRLLKKVKDGKLQIKDLIPNYGTKKYLQVSGGRAEIKTSKIQLDVQWDGLHGVITNQSEKHASTILERYRGLWQIEEAFRVNKHSLKMRPIFHWSPKRIKAHILICFMAFTLVKSAIFRLNRFGNKISCEKLRESLSEVEASIVRDNRSKRRFVIPAETKESHRLIYRCFGLKRDDKPYAI